MTTSLDHSEQAPAARANKSSLYALVVMTLAYILSYIDRQVLSLMVEPMRRDLQISDTQIGLLQGFAFSIFYVIAGIPLARLIDSGNRRNIVAACVTLWSLMTAGCGLAQNYVTLLMMRIGVSVGEAGLPPAAFSMMSDLFPKNRVARATSFFMIGPYVGSGLALLLGGFLLQYFSALPSLSLPLVGSIQPWQATFVALGLPGIAVAILLRFTLREPARTQEQAIVPTVADTARYFWAYRRVLVPHFAGTSFVVMIAFAHMAWIPAFFVRHFGKTEAWVGAVYGPMYLVLGIAGALLAGVVSIRPQASDPVQVVSRVLIIASAVLIVPGVFAPLLGGPWLALGMLAPAVLCYSAILALAPVPIQLLAPNRMRAQFTALLALISSLVGVGAGPVLVGVLSDFVFRGGATNGLAYSLAAVPAVAGPIALLLFIYSGRQCAGLEQLNVTHDPRLED